eukprot:CAMPEP_0201565292 /NCGR_PEP_ID=MMETSP0190_2-20130828/4309_1 /ASSEMBLY_ACC=CAM_ASM_000263 /TAXON_ID=37353 /ORGANISM="Rosalina sp." /LENGTH=249 /DNA_ID=CAMNT_0047982617 /DNA_START=20 /DNA_END=769 /DNA_ORIENTATION=+
MTTEKEQMNETNTGSQDDETAKEIIDLAQSVTPEPALKRRKLDGNSSVITSVASSIPSETTSNTNSNSNDNNKNRKRKRMEIETIDITQDSSSNETSATTSNEIDINTNKKKKKKSKRKNKNDIFSSYAIKKIIKGDQTLNNFQVSAEAVNIIGKVTQHFMDELLKGSISNSTNNELEYDNIANYIDSSDKFSFLSDIVPPRITFNKAANKNKIRKEMNQLPISNENSNNDNKQKSAKHEKEEMDQDEK